MALSAGRPSKRTTDHVEKAKEQLIDEKEKRLNVRMKNSEYRKLEEFAFHRRKKLSDVVREALDFYMNKVSK